MDTFVDYYELLHVQPSAPSAVIKASYRTMLQKLNHHPDRGGDVAFAQLLNQAAETLCKPATRERYDSLRQRYLASQSHGAAVNTAGGRQTESSWGEPGGSPTSQRPHQTHNERSDTHSKRKNPWSGHDSRQSSSITHPLLPAAPQCPFCRTLAPAVTQTNILAYARPSHCSGCNGASTPIEQIPRDSNEELRRMHRQNHTSEAQLWSEWPQTSPETSTLADFSPEGCALRASRQLSNGQVVMVETPLFNAICEVRYCRSENNERYAVGLSFVTLDIHAAPGSLLVATA